MKLMTVLIAGAVLLAPAVALAEHPHPQGARRQQLIEKFDEDGDGKLQGAEKKKAKRAMKKHKRERKRARFLKIMRALDTNHDGYVTDEEFQAGVRQ